VVAATIVDVVQPRQVVDVLVLVYNADSDAFAIVDDAPVLNGIEVTTTELVVLAYSADADELAVVDDAAVLRGIEVTRTVLVLVDTDIVAELVAFCVIVLVAEEVEFANITLVVLAAAGAIVKLVVTRATDVEFAFNTGAWVVVAEATELEFVRDASFGAVVVLLTLIIGVEVLEIIDVVFENVAGVIDAVDNAATVVVFGAMENVDSGIFADNVVEVLYRMKVVLDEVFEASGALDVKTGRDDVRISEDVLLDTSVSAVVEFRNVLEVARAADDEVIVLEVKVISLLVVLRVVVAAAEEDDVCGTDVLVATMDD